MIPEASLYMRALAAREGLPQPEIGVAEAPVPFPSPFPRSVFPSHPSVAAHPSGCQPAGVRAKLGSYPGFQPFEGVLLQVLGAVRVVLPTQT